MNLYGARRLNVRTQIGPRSIRTVTLRPGQTFLVGRGEDCDLRLIVPRMSKHHFLIYGRNADWFVRDLASRNGTSLNNVLVESEMPLTSKDEIEAGDIRFHISFVTILDRLTRWVLPMKSLGTVSSSLTNEPLLDSWLGTEPQA